jgi:uncharacterized protein
MKKLLLGFSLFLATVAAAQAQTSAQKVYTAVVKNQAAAVETLLAAGADVNATVEMMPGFPTTYLFLAAENGHPEVVKTLLRYKAQVDKPDSFGATPLMAAAAKGSLEIVQALLAGGANPKAKDKDGKDVLTNAREGGNAEVLKLLQAKQ